ncbi:hypothetical protein KIW84_033304 [Lathyrus oleraceus]|uniref:RRM domain-containing protein n=1 Tax=Pisum sativum TaxID=3888 RepID=A0A9D4XVF2_PEA|nr:hypothetical protein KIW84_033304 [Pisum sativum]
MSHRSGNSNASTTKSELIGNDTVSTLANSRQRLRLNPNKKHNPEAYVDLKLDFGPSIFSLLERHFPPNMLVISHDDKTKLTTEILLKYLPNGERNRVIIDRSSGRSKGFAFVSYATVEEVENAKEGMNAKFLDGLFIFVDLAKPREL